MSLQINERKNFVKNKMKNNRRVIGSPHWFYLARAGSDTKET